MCSPDPYSMMALAQTIKAARIGPGSVIEVSSPDDIRWVEMPAKPEPTNCRNCGAPPDGGHVCLYCGSAR